VNRQQRRAGKHQSGPPRGAADRTGGLLARAIGHHQAGRLAEAEGLYRQILSLDGRHADSLHLLGVVAYQTGRLELAAEMIGKAIALNDRVPAFHANLGNVLQDLGKLEEAIAHYEQALALKPDFPETLSNLGNALQARGRLDEAIARYRRAIAGRPDFADALHNLGLALFGQGRPQDALACHQRALACRPGFADALLNLGHALRGTGRQADAVARYEQALAIKPGFPEALSNLGAALNEQGKMVEAIAPIERATNLDPDSAEAHNDLALALIGAGAPERALAVALSLLQRKETAAARFLFAECLAGLTNVQAAAGVRDLVLRALAEAWARPTVLANSAIGLIKLNPTVGRLAAAPAACETGLAERDFAALSDLAGEPLLLCLLRAVPICDAALERVLTACRSVLLREAARDPASGAFAGPGLAFLAALAQQCFINEYVFVCTDEELALVRRLSAELSVLPEKRAAVAVSRLAALAAYAPLHSLPGAERLLGDEWPEPVRALLTQQIAEPLEELRWRAEIPRLTAIGEGVSSLVRQQYEENPYPRWVKADPIVPRRSIDHYIRGRLPGARFVPLEKPDPDILIAGCGTGMHPIQVARLFPRGRVLAVDLSLASLGYALRKTRELGLDNLQYAQADLLRLGGIDRQFDIIEAVGVLHHLDDPAAGLAVLVSLLRSRGLLKLGLYSARARQDVVSVRAFIAERGYGRTPADIRRCRQDLFALDDRDGRRKVMSRTDAASTSGCRDLLFHVQEHRLSLPTIAEWLRRFGLTCVGLETDAEIRRRFRARFAGAAADADLGLWDAFEQENPDSFAGMYHLWAQKNGDCAASSAQPTSRPDQFAELDVLNSPPRPALRRVK
jgi:tetratricopeptide (TPR) repeat protein/SAM-dependent methyltransferase